MSSVSLPTPQQFEDARRVVADHLRPTPTVELSIRGRAAYAKLDLLQPTGSFKVRGALAAVAAALRDDPNGAVVTSSAGNHGLGIALASTILGARATVVVPETASPIKVDKLLQFDIELIQHGDVYDDAQAFAKDLAERKGIRYVSPFNDPDVIAGQSTCFDEMLTQAPDLDQLVVSVGGGGLISGALSALEACGRDDVRVIGVQPENSAAMYHVLRGATMAEVTHFPTIADGLAGGGDDDAVTTRLVEKRGVSLVLVPETAIRRAVRESVEINGIVMEGSAAASYAAVATDLIGERGRHVGFVATGRNIAHDSLLEILNEPLN